LAVIVPAGTDEEAVLDQCLAASAARADTPAWMKGFLDTFYNADTLRGTLVSDQAYQASWNLAVTASASQSAGETRRDRKARTQYMPKV